MAFRAVSTVIGISLAMLATPVAAQDSPEPRRTRIGIGPQLVPSYPGADGISVRPLIDVSRARGDAPFEFEAADESFGFALVNVNGFAVGPSLGFEGSRERDDVGGVLPRVGTTFEVGGFAQYQFNPALRVRAEVRKGLGGHRGWIGTVGADYIWRRGDYWLVSVGPRVTLSDGRYQRAYFGVAPGDAAASGLTAFTPGGGIQAIGANLGYIRQLTRKWGVYSYAKYDRLVDDAGQSPVVRRFGSRNQLSGGVALTYTFGR